MFAKTIVAVAFAALAVAAPTRLEQRDNSNMATFYDLNSSAENDGWGGGQVACSNERYGNNDYIAAIRNGDSHCGKKALVTNQRTGKTVTVTIEDDCASCHTDDTIDLPKGVWKDLADGRPESDGVIPIEWHFI